MKDNINLEKEIKPVRLRLELLNEYFGDEEKRILKRYGRSQTGYSIVRDILIPSDMPLHNLHYAIQRLFGWQNSHLRCFNLPKKRYDQLTNKTVKGWSDLVGVLFQPPSENEEDIFWDDDYIYGNIKSWLRKKYTGPYVYEGYYEIYENARTDVENLLKRFNIFEVREPFDEYYARLREDENAKIKIIKTVPLIDVTLEEMQNSLFVDGTDYLLERLKVVDVIGYWNEEINSDSIFPTTNELIYNYDFGDNWIVKIRKYKDCADLLENKDISEEDLQEAKETVLSKHKPVCINFEGRNVLDDVGGMFGYVNFLKTVYESDDKEEAESLLFWAESLGWSPTKIRNKRIL